MSSEFKAEGLEQDVKREEFKKKRRAGTKLSKTSGPKFTLIGGQKVDLNSEKPQYLKLTLEQIQLLALQQRAGQSNYLKLTIRKEDVLVIT